MKWRSNSYNKISMYWTLYSGHLCIVDIIFNYQFTLPLSAYLSIADTPNNMSYKAVLLRKLYTFYFWQCFTVSTECSSIFFILSFSQFIGLARSIKMKIRWNFQSVFTSMVDAFPSWKMFKAQWARDKNMDTIIEISVAHGQPSLLYSEN